MKQIGNQHGEIHAPQPGGDGEGARPKASDDLIIVPLPDDFDIDTLFRSEQELAEATLSAPAGEARAMAPAPDPVRVNPEPRLLLSPEPPLSLNSEPVSHERAKAPSLSIADLIDNHVRLEWFEAVAIAQHLCYVMARDPAASLHTSLVEPWNVEITNSGEVQVLPGGSSSDPLVKQVGRVLRVLLQDSFAPPELRLVAAQASFDVPVYSSVDELSVALRHFERSGEVDAIRAAFNRGLDAKFSVSSTHVRVAPVAGPPAPPVDEQSGTPKSVPAAASVIWRPRPRSSSLQVFAAVAAAVIAVILIATALVMSRRTPTPEERPVASISEPQVRQIETPPSAPSASAPPVSTAPASTPPPSTLPEIAPQPSPEVVAAPKPLSVPVPKSRPVTNTRAPAISPRVLRPLAGARTVSPLATPSPRYIAPTLRPPTTSDSLQADERQAAVLLESGRADEAAMFFDAIVMRNPLHQLDPARTSPEALLAFRNSKRVLLPALARRHYQDARAAFDAGDFSLAISEGERAMALLNDTDIEAAPADLKSDVPDLLARASASRTVEEERVYALGDSGVTPPRPLGRQLSTASQSRTSFRPTGRLEILVGRTGRVESVKLDTPLNGYHDRMLVSAAKAWHYKPALRNGKPVRFTLVMSINLPDL